MTDARLLTTQEWIDANAAVDELGSKACLNMSPDEILRLQLLAGALRDHIAAQDEQLEHMTLNWLNCLEQIKGLEERIRELEVFLRELSNERDFRVHVPDIWQYELGELLKQPQQAKGEGDNE